MLLPDHARVTIAPSTTPIGTRAEPGLPRRSESGADRRDLQARRVREEHPPRQSRSVNLRMDLPRERARSKSSPCARRPVRAIPQINFSPGCVILRSAS